MTTGTLQRLALELGPLLPEVRWTYGDALCDCTFQRIGEWMNPYIGRTMRIRFCCVWAEFARQYPQYFEIDIPGYWDENAQAFVPGTWDWDSEDEPMPRHLWYRQLAVRTGKTLAEVRDEYHDKEPPGPVPPGFGRSKYREQ